MDDLLDDSGALTTAVASQVGWDDQREALVGWVTLASFGDGVSPGHHGVRQHMIFARAQRGEGPSYHWWIQSYEYDGKLCQYEDLYVDFHQLLADLDAEMGAVSDQDSGLRRTHPMMYGDTVAVLRSTWEQRVRAFGLRTQLMRDVQREWLFSDLDHWVCTIDPHKPYYATDCKTPEAAIDALRAKIERQEGWSTQKADLTDDERRNQRSLGVLTLRADRQDVPWSARILVERRQVGGYCYRVADVKLN